MSAGRPSNDRQRRARPDGGPNNSADRWEGKTLSKLAARGHADLSRPGLRHAMYRHLAKHRLNLCNYKKVHNLAVFKELLVRLEIDRYDTEEWKTLVHPRVERQLGRILKNFVDNNIIREADDGVSMYWPQAVLQALNEDWQDGSWSQDIPKLQQIATQGTASTPLRQVEVSNTTQRMAGVGAALPVEDQDFSMPDVPSPPPARCPVFGGQDFSEDSPSAGRTHDRSFGSGAPSTALTSASGIGGTIDGSIHLPAQSNSWQRCQHHQHANETSHTFQQTPTHQHLNLGSSEMGVPSTRTSSSPSGIGGSIRGSIRLGRPTPISTTVVVDSGPQTAQQHPSHDSELSSSLRELSLRPDLMYPTPKTPSRARASQPTPMTPRHVREEGHRKLAEGTRASQQEYERGMAFAQEAKEEIWRDWDETGTSEDLRQLLITIAERHGVY